MPGPFESVLYVQDRMGGIHELINQARSAAYLAHPDLALDGLSICDILDFGGCENYAYEPYCGPDYGGYVEFPGTASNYLRVPLRTAFYDTFTGKSNGAFTTADSGQTYNFYHEPTLAGQFTVVSGKAVTPGSVNGLSAAYMDANLGANVRRNGARWTFSSSGSTNTGVMVLLAWAAPFANGPVPDSSLHLRINPTSAVYDVWDGGSIISVLPNGHVAHYTFPVPLATDGTTQHVADVRIEGDTATVLLPNGVTLTYTHPLIAAQYCPHAGWEEFCTNQSTDHRVQIMQAWADTTPSQTTSPAAVDPSIDWRVEVIRPANPAVAIDTFANPLFIRLLASSLSGFFNATDASNPAASATYAALEGAGHPLVGERVQWRTDWNASTDTLSLRWRLPGIDLNDDTGWTTAASVVHAGKQIRTTDLTMNLGGASSTPFPGKVYRWLRRVNGVLDIDVNPYVDFDGIDPAVATFEASTGQVITVFRTGTPSTLLVDFVANSEWLPLTFTTPALDPAPWYNANYPQSADALGFYITAWTGLDDGHIKRSSQPIGGYGGGSRLSPISSDGRIMKLNIIIFGRSNEATEYLFRWLAATLSGVCATCETNSILIRRYCGSIEDPWDGVVQLRNVGLVEGLKWEADLVERGACYMRQASFALEAGDPCMYLPDTDRPVSVMDADADVDACLAGLTLNADREFCRPGCSELTANCRTIRTFEVDPLGAMAPVITWDNTQNSYTYPFRAIIYADPGETGAVPNPCGLQVLGELYVRSLPPSSSMRWDITGRTIEYRDHTTGGWVGGWAYTQASDPPNRRFFALPCGVSQLVMEPSSMCAEEVDPTEFTLDGVTYDPPRFPTVSIVLQERIGCI